MQASIYVAEPTYEILAKHKPEDRTVAQYMSDIVKEKADELKKQTSG